MDWLSKCNMRTCQHKFVRRNAPSCLLSIMSFATMDARIALVVAVAIAVVAGRTMSTGLSGPGIVPKWNHTYQMNMSTAFMPCNYSGYFDPSFSAKFGLADYDWSDGKAIWANVAPMNNEELLVEQAQMTKALRPDMKVFVYRNLVKALPIIRSFILELCNLLALWFPVLYYYYTALLHWSG